MRVKLSGTSGSFDIPGIPAERTYFVKVLVFEPGSSEDIIDLLQERVSCRPELLSIPAEDSVSSLSELNFTDARGSTVEAGETADPSSSISSPDDTVVRTRQLSSDGKSR